MPRHALHRTVKSYPQPAPITYLGKGEGLPSLQVHDLAYAANTLWLATPGGLTISNGRHFRTITTDDGLQAHGLRSVYAGEKVLLVGSDTGVDFLDQETLEVFHSARTVTLGMGFVDSMLLDKSRCWMGTAGGLLAYDVELASFLPVAEAVGNLRAIKIASTALGLLMVTDEGSLWRYRDDCWDNLSESYMSLAGLLRNLVCTQQAVLLICEQGIVALNPQTQQAELVYNDQPTGPACLAGADLWLAQDDELLRLQVGGEFLLVLDRYSGIPEINTIVTDKFDNIWFATEASGLGKLTCLRDSIRLISSGDSPMLSFRPTLEHGIFCGGSAKSFLMSADEKPIIVELPEFSEDDIWDSLPDSLGNLWVATERGLMAVDKASGAAGALRQLLPGPGRVLETLGDDMLYGSARGLYRFSPATGDTSSVECEGKALGYVYTLMRDEAVCYIGTLGQGLWRYHLPSQQLEQVPLSPAALNVYCIDRDQRGRIILGADNKVLLLEDERCTCVLETTTALACWAICWLSQDSIALGTPDGLSVYSLSRETLELEIKQFPSQVYWEFTTSRSLCRLGENELLCGLNNGLARVNLERLHKLKFTPAIKLQAVDCTAPIVHSGDSISVSYGVWRINLSFTSDAYLLDPAMSLSYQVVGLDQKWNAMENNTASLTSLPAGNYQVNVCAESLFLANAHEQPVLMINVTPLSFLGRCSHFLKLWLGSLGNEIAHPFKNRKLRNTNWQLEEAVARRTRQLEENNSKLELLNKELLGLSTTDELTRVANRRQLMIYLEQELRRAARQQQPTAFFILDVDYFKPYNDNYGHSQGDACLRQVAALIKDALPRSGNLVARYGGEEFAVVLPNTDRDNAIAAAERILNLFRTTKIEHRFSKIKDYLTVSIGVAISQPVGEQRIDSLVLSREVIHRADKKLYVAKHAGRDQYAI